MNYVFCLDKFNQRLSHCAQYAQKGVEIAAGGVLNSVKLGKQDVSVFSDYWVLFDQ